MVRMRAELVLVAVGVVVLFSTYASTQQQQGQAAATPQAQPRLCPGDDPRTSLPCQPRYDTKQAFLLPASRVRASAARLPKDRGNASDYYAERFETPAGSGPFFRIGMEHRMPKYAQNAAVHELESEFWSVIEGALTITTGGKLMNPRHNGNNWSATAIEGGTPMRLQQGDHIMIPNGVAHQVTNVEGDGALIVTFELGPHVRTPAVQ